jgi:hypothetical protein
MTTQQNQAAATERLRRALLAFQTAQNHLLSAERRLKGLPHAEVAHQPASAENPDPPPGGAAARTP